MRNRPWRRRLWSALALLPAIWLLLVWRVYPYLAITQTTGSKVLVVEGWMDPAAMREAAQLITDSGYTRVYTTGTVRPFAYLLGGGEGISVLLEEPVQGKLRMEAIGVPGAGILLMADGDTLLREPLTAEMYLFHAELGRPCRRLLVKAWNQKGDDRAGQAFVQSLTVNGQNINLFQRRSWFLHTGEASMPAWPTYAHSARSELIGLGIDPGIVLAVPAYGKPRSRSWGNAHAFGQQARIDGITAFDVATQGVHARRSRSLFRTAVGPDVQVGVVALHDPYTTRRNWWRSLRGWITMAKEVIGAPEADMVQLKKLAVPDK